jgi:hypothetical protein
VPNDELRIIDTSNGLTKEELAELKKLAALSKTAKFFMGILFSLFLFIGFDHLVDWFQHKGA